MSNIANRVKKLEVNLSKGDELTVLIIRWGSDEPLTKITCGDLSYLKLDHESMEAFEDRAIAGVKAAPPYETNKVLFLWLSETEKSNYAKEKL